MPEELNKIISPDNKTNPQEKEIQRKNIQDDTVTSALPTGPNMTNPKAIEKQIQNNKGQDDNSQDNQTTKAPTPISTASDVKVSKRPDESIVLLLDSINKIIKENKKEQDAVFENIRNYLENNEKRTELISLLISAALLEATEENRKQVISILISNFDNVK